MSRGWKIPVGVDPTGGIAEIDGEENDQKTIFAALSDCDNENAFQQNLGIGVSMIFDINDSVLRARILRKLKEIFREFENDDRYKLLTETIEWAEKEGELELKFKYMNLETDETITFARSYAIGQSATDQSIIMQ